MARKVSRTFGWVQNPSNSRTLYDVVTLFVCGSKANLNMREKRIPFLLEYDCVDNKEKFQKYIELLSRTKIVIPYTELKGKGAGRGSRRVAKCSGLLQAAINSQKDAEYVHPMSGMKVRLKKPYTDDWTADGFLRWAISLGFIDYNRDNDTCSISKRGLHWAEAGTEKAWTDILGEAYLSYPPAVRVLYLLKENGHLTKFEIGSQLGFVGEQGFTSVNQDLWIEAVNSESADERIRVRQNLEGSSDKYARMIGRWLADIGWVREESRERKAVFGDTEYRAEIAQSFRITLEGTRQLNRALGLSSHRKVPKIVYYEMLATKSVDKEYLRLRRGYILQCLQSGKPRTLEQVKAFLYSKGIDENISVIRDDIDGLYQIGLHIACRQKKYVLYDKLERFDVPSANSSIAPTRNAVLKSKVSERLEHLNHKHLVLLDVAYDGKANREFELETIDLLTKTLAYKGRHLGGTRKPDNVIYYGSKGMIIDNKAYSSGYNLPRGQIDEMVRYISENEERNVAINPLAWWEAFADEVKKFYYGFVSSEFTGNFEVRLEEIAQRTGVSGGAISAENLLYMAEDILAGRLSYDDSFALFARNKEVIL